MIGYLTKFYQQSLHSKCPRYRIRRASFGYLGIKIAFYQQKEHNLEKCNLFITKFPIKIDVHLSEKMYTKTIL